MQLLKRILTAVLLIPIVLLLVLRAPVSVVALIAALVALLDSNIEGPVNIASGEAVSVAEVVQEIAHQLERPNLVQLGALPSAEDEPPLLVADVARLRDEVGWSPRYDLASGLAETINWWKLSLPERGMSK